MPRVKKAKWKFPLNMQNPACPSDDNGAAPCRRGADSVGGASKALTHFEKTLCFLTLGFLRLDKCSRKEAARVPVTPERRL